MNMNPFKTILFVLLSILLGSCSNSKKVTSKQNLDFSSPKNWAFLPSQIEKKVDVFFVYPTLFGGTAEMNMDITNDSLRNLVQAALLKQCSVFSSDCNMFAPYYRQMSFDGLSMDEAERDKYFSLGLNDIEQAFDYYLKNLNNGRPFIIAGHSQGSQVLLNMMKNKFNDPELMDKLVAAYLIGYSVTNKDLAENSWLKMAQTDNDIGVIISYNTQSQNAKGSPVLLSNANCINPLNWVTTSEYAPRELNLGAVFFKDNGEIDSIVPQFTDAWIDENGALVAGISEVQTYSVSNFPEGVYHKFDYSFFYKNLVENVHVRNRAYFDKRH